MTKQEIRKLYLQKRKQLEKITLEALRTQMLGHFSRLQLPAIKVLLSYSSLSGHNEFDVAGCESILRNRHPQIVSALPRIDAADNSMEAVEINDGGGLTLNQYGIPEPLGGRIINPEIIDLVFVPLIAFDTRGFRVGYGKGYYDRFLKRCREDCCTVGFSFFEAVDPPGDIREFDVPLDFCISPLRVYEF